jgi:ribosomal protein S8
MLSIVSIKNAQCIQKGSVVVSIRTHHIPILSILERLGYIRSYETLPFYGSGSTVKVNVKLGYYKRLKLIRVLDLYLDHKPKNCTYTQLLRLSAYTKGIYIISTFSHGICSHLTALEHKVGGRLIAYVE